ncbi:Uncharacterised protein [Escherichia coli]|nr:Uncharacterised protein [Escherichia coli]
MIRSVRKPHLGIPPRLFLIRIALRIDIFFRNIRRLIFLPGAEKLGCLVPRVVVIDCLLSTGGQIAR